MAEDHSMRMDGDREASIAIGAIAKLDSTLESLTSEIRRLNKTTNDLYGDYSKNTTEQRRSVRRDNYFDFDNVKSSGKDLAETITKLQKQFKGLEKQSKLVEAEWKLSSSGKRFGTQYLQSTQQSKLLSDYIAKLEGIQRELELKKNKVANRSGEYDKKIGDLVQEMTQKINEDYIGRQQELASKKSELEKRASSRKTPKSKRSELRDEIKSIAQEIESIKKEQDTKLKSAESEAINKILEDIQKSANEKEKKIQEDYQKGREQLDEQLEELSKTLSISNELVSNAENASSALSSVSSSYADYLKKNVEQKPYEKMKDMISDAQVYFKASLENIEKTITELDDILSKSGLSDEEKEYYEKQKALALQQQKNLKAEQEFWKDAKPATITFKDAAQTMKTAMGNVLKNIGANAIKYMEDKYLNAYKEGFNNVYNSIESTRNSVSARLRLDQGGFSELQSEIQSEIEARGFEGTITQSDVNEALVALSSAGITDESMLKSLALQSAKMKALGSSFDLGNEETLQRVQEMYRNEIAGGASQEESMTAITSMMDDLLAYEVNIRETMGDAGLINNQMNQVFNQLSNLGLASGADTKQIEKAIEAGMYAANTAYYQGLDPTVYTSMMQELMDNSTAQNSIINKILEVNGSLTRDQLEKYIKEEPSKIYEIIQETTNAIIKNPELDETYLREYLDAFGISMSTVDASKLRKSASASTSITDIEITQAQKDQAKATNEMALQDSRYQSATATWQDKMENEATELAIKADEMYKGNEIVNAGFQAVEGLLGGIENTALNILSSMWTNNFTSTLSGGQAQSFITGGLTGKGAENASGYATAGKVVGAVAGGAIMTKSVYENIVNKAETDDAVDVVLNGILSDPEFYGGLGTTLGSAIAGPLGGAIGGAIGTLASTLGNKLADPISDALVGETELLQDVVSDISDKYSEEYDKYMEQYDIQTEMLKNFKTMSVEQKRAYMKQHNILEDELANGMTEKEILETFESNVIQDASNKAEEARQLAEKAAILADESKVKSLEATKDLLGSDQYTQYLRGYSGDELEKASHDILLNTLGDTFEDLYNIKDIYSEMGINQLELNLKSLGMSEQDIANIKEASGGDKTLYQKYLAQNATTKQREKVLQGAGYSSYDMSKVISAVDYHGGLIDNYLNSNSEFQGKWEDAYNASAEKDDDSVIRTYREMFGVYPDIEYDEYYNIIHDESGNPYLSKHGGKYRETYEFKTGLTNVPYDNYFATLHKGERVLTAEEAEAYNEMSSYAVSNFADSINNYGNSSNVFNTTSYGLGNVETSINNQTQSIMSVLNQILASIKSLSISISTGSTTNMAKASMLMGNTSLTQISTM